MIRNVVMVKLQDDVDREDLGAIQAGLAALDPSGCIEYTIGDDLGLRDGNWSFAIVADFADEESYRAYDADAEHNRLRDRLKPYIAEIARAQFSVPD